LNPMHDRHSNKRRYFSEQGTTTKKYIIPYVEKVMTINTETRVLEIGCGEGGNLMPFLELGCEAIGVDLHAKQIERAKIFTIEDIPEAKVKFLNENIYNLTIEEIGKFDLIMLKDVIEHIPNQEKFMGHLKQFLKPQGKVFFGFPPWRMPFGGHQQVCKSKLLSKLPYFHLLPKPIYKLILKAFKVHPSNVKELLEIKSTGISIRRFENIVKTNNYRIAQKTYFLINPNYEIKFGLKPKEQIGLIAVIPYFKDFFTTCVYCIIENQN